MIEMTERFLIKNKILHLVFDIRYNITLSQIRITYKNTYRLFYKWNIYYVIHIDALRLY